MCYSWILSFVRMTKWHILYKGQYSMHYCFHELFHFLTWHEMIFSYARKTQLIHVGLKNVVFSLVFLNIGSFFIVTGYFSTYLTQRNCHTRVKAGRRRRIKIKTLKSLIIP